MVCPRHSGSRIRPGVLAAGSALVAVGGGMLLDRYEVVDINPGQLIGPVVLIVLGTSMLVRGPGAAVDAGTEKDRERRRQTRFGALALIGIGAWLLVSQTHLFGLTFGTSWPLLLILWGVLITMRGWR